MYFSKLFHSNPLLIFALVPTLAFASVKFSESDHKDDNKTHVVFKEQQPVPTYKNVYKTKTVKPISYKDRLSFKNSVDCLTEAIYFEARGESVKNKLGVFDSIINRTAYKNLWGNTVCDTIEEPYQYSYKNTKYEYNLDNVIENKAYKEIRELVKNTYSSYKKGVYKPSKTHYYYNPNKVKTKPNWVDEKYFLFSSGNHRYYSWHKNS